MERFTPEKVHYFRAKIDRTRPRSFADVVRYFQRECALARGNAIIAARRTYPNLYNAEQQLFHQRKLSAPSHLAKRESQVQVMSMRHRNGVPVVQFQGL